MSDKEDCPYAPKPAGITQTSHPKLSSCPALPSHGKHSIDCGLCFPLIPSYILTDIGASLCDPAGHNVPPLSSTSVVALTCFFQWWTSLCGHSVTPKNLNPTGTFTEMTHRKVNAFLSKGPEMLPWGRTEFIRRIHGEYISCRETRIYKWPGGTKLAWEQNCRFTQNILPVGNQKP